MKIAEIKVDLIDHMGNDLSVVNAARVSFNKESWFILGDFTTKDGGHFPKMLQEKDQKLINYLAKHKHLSPFNHTFMTFRVKAPIFVARQLVKHEYMPWNEVSRRYVDEDPEFYIPKKFRQKADNVKQGSAGSMANSDSWVEELKDFSEASLNIYRNAGFEGMCPEQSRIFLPHNLMTEWFWSGTLGAVGKMLNLRLDSHTQEETRDVAFMVRDLVEPLFPVSLNALLGSFK